MKTLYVTRNNNILIDNEADTVNRLNASRVGIDTIYLAKEPMHVVYGYADDEKEEFDVKKGDIIISFYVNSFKNKIVVVKNKKWTDNLFEEEKREQEEKLRWAAEKAKNLNTTCDSKESEH